MGCTGARSTVCRLALLDWFGGVHGYLDGRTGCRNSSERLYREPHLLEGAAGSPCTNANVERPSVCLFPALACAASESLNVLEEFFRGGFGGHVTRASGV
jgi:hypothetical protein